MPILLHAADLHLDSPFSGLPPDKAALRRQEQRELLARLTALVHSHGVQLVLLSGDVLDRGAYHSETAAALLKALEQMEVPVFLSPGNHDPAPLYAGLNLPENVTVFPSESMSSVSLPNLNCTVHGRAFVQSACTVPFSDLSFRVPDDGQTHLLCLHGEVGGQTLRFGPIAPDALAQSGVTYAALGHIHRGSGLQHAGNTVWAYPGCPEGRGFDELGDKGVLLGSVEPDRVALDFIPVCRRRYHVVSADLTDASSAESALLNALPEGCTDDVVRVLLTGESETPDLSALTALAGAHCFSAEVQDHTTVRRDLLKRSEEDSLTGYFLRALLAQEGAPGLELARRFGMAALENGEDPKP